MTRVCVFCNGEDHRSVERGKFPSISQRRRILSDKKLCFNCTGTRHQAQDCRSKHACQRCGSRHHTSICDRLPSNNQMMLVTGDHEGSVICPVVVVIVDGIKCRALLDTGAGSSYVSVALVERLNKRPTHVEHKQIEMMLCSTIQKVRSYPVKVASVDGKFEMTTKVNKVDKGVLLTVSNPHYEELISKYPHLEGAVKEDSDKKSELRIYLILGASEYSRIKTETKPRIAKPSEPIAELTSLGWAMMSFLPFLLAGTLRLHLENLRERYPAEVEEILRSLYVDDIISRGSTADEVHSLKKTIASVFGEAKFTMHKWNSNVPQLERENDDPVDEQQSYAKQQLGVKEGKTKMLGLPWNKREDLIATTFPEEPVDVTKKGILRFLAAVYDPLGIASPTMLMGKLLYREVCESRLPWDEKVSDRVGQEWLKFVRSLPDKIEVSRSLARFREPVKGVVLHAFGDTSGSGISSAVYAVITQASGVSKGLIAVKSRIAKKNLTIPRLELIAAHMAANLVDNVRTALEGYPITSVHGWSDSTVALHWIKGGGSYKQFVTNRVRKISSKNFIEWRHVDNNHNPADIRSRGCNTDQLTGTWLSGPEWLPNPEKWPRDIVTKPDKETEAKAKRTKEVIAVAVDTRDDFDEVLEKHTFWRVIRNSTWIRRFLQNCRSRKSNRVSGPLTTAETEKQVKWWIKREQERYSVTEKFLGDQQRLNLQKNDEEISVCRERIQGHYPVYLPPRVRLSEKIVQDALHWGVGSIMAQVRREY